MGRNLYAPIAIKNHRYLKAVRGFLKFGSPIDFYKKTRATLVARVDLTFPNGGFRRLLFAFLQNCRSFLPALAIHCPVQPL